MAPKPNKGLSAGSGNRPSSKKSKKNATIDFAVSESPKTKAQRKRPSSKDKTSKAAPMPKNSLAKRTASSSSGPITVSRSESFSVNSGDQDNASGLKKTIDPAEIASEDNARSNDSRTPSISDLQDEAELATRKRKTPVLNTGKDDDEDMGSTDDEQTNTECRPWIGYSPEKVLSAFADPANYPGKSRSIAEYKISWDTSGSTSRLSEDTLKAFLQSSSHSNAKRNSDMISDDEGDEDDIPQRDQQPQLETPHTKLKKTASFDPDSELRAKFNSAAKAESPLSKKGHSAASGGDAETNEKCSIPSASYPQLFLETADGPGSGRRAATLGFSRPPPEKKVSDADFGTGDESPYSSVKRARRTESDFAGLTTLKDIGEFNVPISYSPDYWKRGSGDLMHTSTTLLDSAGGDVGSVLLQHNPFLGLPTTRKPQGILTEKQGLVPLLKPRIGLRQNLSSEPLPKKSGRHVEILNLANMIVNSNGKFFSSKSAAIIASATPRARSVSGGDLRSNQQESLSSNNSDHPRPSSQPQPSHPQENASNTVASHTHSSSNSEVQSHIPEQSESESRAATEKNVSEATGLTATNQTTHPASIQNTKAPIPTSSPAPQASASQPSSNRPLSQRQLSAHPPRTTPPAVQVVPVASEPPIIPPQNATSVEPDVDSNSDSDWDAEIDDDLISAAFKSTQAPSHPSSQPTKQTGSAARPETLPVQNTNNSLKNNAFPRSETLPSGVPANVNIIPEISPNITKPGASMEVRAIPPTRSIRVEPLQRSTVAPKVVEKPPPAPSSNSFIIDSDFDSDFGSDLDADFDETTMQELNKFFKAPVPSVSVSTATPSGAPAPLQANPSARTANRNSGSTTTALSTTALTNSGNSAYHLSTHSSFDIRNLPKIPGRSMVQEPPAIASQLRNPHMRRFHVVSVTETALSKGQTQFDITGVSSLGIRVKIVLRDQWTACPPSLNDIIHVIIKPGSSSTGMPNHSKSARTQSISVASNLTSIATNASPTIGSNEHLEEIVVDRENNMLIVCPDVLVSATSVAGSFACMRKTVLKSRVKFGDGMPSPPLVYGNMIHQLLQWCMTEKSFDKKFTDSKIQQLVEWNLVNLFLCNISREAATSYMTSKMPAIAEWGSLYIGNAPQIGAKTPVLGHNTTERVAIRKVMSSEERVMAPAYGIKGVIDATANISTAGLSTGSKDMPVPRFVPIEIKTGKRQDASHYAQTALYTLLIDEKYRFFSGEVRGLLIYTETGDTIQVPCLPNEMRDVIIARNKLAISMKNRLEPLPELTDHKDTTCANCEYFRSCVVYNNIIENQTPEVFGAGLSDRYRDLVASVGPEEREFFKKWDTLLGKEEGEMAGHLKELWTMVSKDRENVGRCFSHVKLQNLVPSSSSGFVYNFERSDPKADGPFNTEESWISMGEAVFITDEETQVVVANGSLYRASTTQIQVSFRSAIVSPWDVDTPLNSNRFFRPPSAGLSAEHPANLGNLANFSARNLRIDLDEFTTSLALARRNLVELVLQKGDANLRKLLLHNQVPAFVHSVPPYEIPGLNNGKVQFNVDQHRALDKVISAKHCALILGMPGTGKTTTIASLIDTLVKLGKTVLLTSYTHSAVDNILLKIMDNGYNILRLGRISALHPDVRKFAPGDVTEKSDVDRIYMSPSVVATTCLSIEHWIFSKRRFDYCIIDEASQITLPVCLGPLMLADNFVLVGDHYQLPPLVKNSEALEGGLDISLFRYLNDKYPEAVINLEHQYRMCEDIMVLSNSLIYEGRLKCGSRKAATQTLAIPIKNAINPWKSVLNRGPEDDWLSWVLDENRKVLFLDTHNIPNSMETNKDDSLQNRTEATLVHTIVEALCLSGVVEPLIGVISVYRSQLRLINQMLRHRKNVERLTADRFQGRDKDCVIISLVRSNSQNQIGDLLQDWRRLNVAFTRAKSKLIIIGSRSTLEAASALSAFLKLMDDNNWSYSLPPRANEMYTVPVLAARSQSTDSLQSQGAGSSGAIGNLGGPSGIKEKANSSSTAGNNTGSTSTSQSQQSYARPAPPRFGPGIRPHINNLGPVSMNALAEMGITRPSNQRGSNNGDRSGNSRNNNNRQAGGGGNNNRNPNARFPDF